MLVEVLVVPDVLDDVEVVLPDVCEPDVLVVPVVVVVVVVLDEVPLSLVVESAALPSVVAAGVPWMVREPMPEALESKLFCVPFSVTVTAPGLPARMVIESVTV